MTEQPCPTCTGSYRQTVGMACPTCGTDYAPAPVLLGAINDAIDRAEAEARAGTSDAAPDFMLRLITRDRAILARHVREEHWASGIPGSPKALLQAYCTVCFCGSCGNGYDWTCSNVDWPCPDVRAVADFWDVTVDA